ncbi:MAG: ATP-binding cassette domain-containing protein [Proteobacteria bacterium]|nr:ATP-binding cassette domain-containing protein [Pseudomonadota bacterium]
MLTFAAEIGGFGHEAPFIPPAIAEPEPERPAALEFAVYGLTKTFSGRNVLDSLDLDVRAGEFVAIIGRSGCGKSTFLRLLAGLDSPTSGIVAFGPEGRERHGSDVRVMFQEPRLLPWASIAENVAIGAGDRPEPETRRNQAALALGAVGLGDRAEEWPSVLSGGQKQRVALARALVSGPGILALDEPLGALDALTRIEMQGLLERVWLDKGFTALMVTHDVPEAIALADRVVLIEDGRVTLDLRIDLPRPRKRGTPEFAELEREVLARLMQRAS